MTAPPADLLARVRARLVSEGSRATPDAVARAVRAEVGVGGDQEVLAVVSALRAELVGAGPLEPLLADPDVTDIVVNGPTQVWVDRGLGLQPAGVRFPDETALRRLAERLVASIGRRLDDAAPYADARLPDGTRVHAVLPPVVAGGTHLSLRVPPRRAFTLPELVAAGSVTPDGADLLRRIVTAGVAFVVTGGTGSGKTTLLSALLSLVPRSERVVLIEDSAELRPDHPHVVRLEARAPNIEGAGGVPLHALVRQALRMRPDRIVVGEVRGAEVVDLLAALNTGHAGGCGTLHANRPADVPARLEALGVAAGLSREAVHSQAAAALHVVVHVARAGARRLVSEVGVLRRGGDGLVTAHPAFRRVGDAWVPAEAAAELLARIAP